MENQINIVLTDQPLNVEECRRFAEIDANGAVVVFEGSVRNQTRNQVVSSLFFEAYEDMAIREMEKIAIAALEKWPVSRVAMHHRTGLLQIGELPVVIAVGSAHRDAAFDACRFCIDTLKETVPIWKKEIFENGEEWVSPTP